MSPRQCRTRVSERPYGSLSRMLSIKYMIIGLPQPTEELTLTNQRERFRLERKVHRFWTWAYMFRTRYPSQWLLNIQLGRTRVFLRRFAVLGRITFFHIHSMGMSPFSVEERVKKQFYSLCRTVIPPPWYLIPYLPDELGGRKGSSRIRKKKWNEQI